MIIKKGIQVKIITGKDKGKTGEILEIDRKQNKVKVKSINIEYPNNYPQVETGKILETADAGKVLVKVNKHGDSQIDSLLVDGNKWP